MSSARPFSDIGTRIRWWRGYLGLNQTEFAARYNVGMKSVGGWETGVSRLSMDGALKMREVDGLSLDWLITGDDANLPRSIRMAWRDALLAGNKE